MAKVKTFFLHRTNSGAFSVKDQDWNSYSQNLKLALTDKEVDDLNSKYGNTSKNDTVFLDSIYAFINDRDGEGMPEFEDFEEEAPKAKSKVDIKEEKRDDYEYHFKKGTFVRCKSQSKNIEVATKLGVAGPFKGKVVSSLLKIVKTNGAAIQKEIYSISGVEGVAFDKEELEAINETVLLNSSRFVGIFNKNKNNLPFLIKTIEKQLEPIKNPNRSDFFKQEVQLMLDSIEESEINTEYKVELAGTVNQIINARYVEINAEIAKFNAMQNEINGVASMLTDIVGRTLSASGDKEISSDNFRFFRTDNDSCIIEDESLIPEKYKELVPAYYKTNKNDIKKLIKAGESIKGAKVIETHSYSIK